MARNTSAYESTPRSRSCSPTMGITPILWSAKTLAARDNGRTRDVNILELQKTLLSQKAILSTQDRKFENEVHLDYRRTGGANEAFVGPAAGSA